MTYRIMYSMGLLIAAIVFFWALGLAFVGSISRSNNLWERLLISPFVGIGIVLALAGNLIRLDMGMHFIVYSILGVFALLCAISLYSFKKNTKPIITLPVSKFDLSLFLAALIIASIVQGFSYFVLGPGQFIGFGTRDMWNYTVMAQFFMDFPFSTLLSDGNQNPLLPLVDALKYGRVGPSVVQAVVATLFRHNAKEVWGVVSLMGPILLVCPLWLIAQEIRLNPIYRFIAVIIGCTLPGIAWIHLENTFLSHAMSLPLFLLWPYVIHRSLKEPSISFIPTTALIFFAFAYIYADMALLLIILMAIVSAWNIAMCNSFKLGLLKLVPIIGSMTLGSVIIPSYTRSFFELLQLPFVNLAQYPPFGLTVAGLVRAWTVDTAGLTSVQLAHTLTIFTVFLILLCFVGILLLFMLERTSLSIALLLIVSVPIALVSYPTPHTYQYYKAVVSISPILPIGLIYLCQWFRMDGTREGTVIKTGLLASAVAILSLAIYSTTLMGLPLTSKGNVYRDQNFIDLTTKLEASRNKNILVISDNGVAAAWLAYHGRNNKLWFARDFYGTGWPVATTKYQRYLDLSTLPISDCEIEQLMPAFTTNIAGLSQRMGIIVETDNIATGGVGPLAVAIGKPLKLKIVSKDDRSITLSFLATAKSGPNDQFRKIRIGGEDIGFKIFEFQNSQDINYQVSLKSGITNIRIDSIMKKADGLMRTNSSLLSVNLSNLTYF